MFIQIEAFILGAINKVGSFLLSHCDEPYKKE